MSDFSKDLIRFLYAREMVALLAAHSQPLDRADAEMMKCAAALDAHFTKPDEMGASAASQIIHQENTNG